MKTREQFRAHHMYKFLCKYKLFDKFIRNTLDTSDAHHMTRRIAASDFLSNKIDCITFLERVANIDSAFTWNKTPEGQTFWERLNYEESHDFYQLWFEYQRMTKKS